MKMKELKEGIVSCVNENELKEIIYYLLLFLDFERIDVRKTFELYRKELYEELLEYLRDVIFTSKR